MTEEEMMKHHVLLAELKFAAVMFAFSSERDSQPRLTELCRSSAEFGKFCQRHGMFLTPEVDCGTS